MLQAPFISVGYVDVRVVRQSQGSWVDGEWINADPQVITIKANIQPIIAKDDSVIAAEADFTKAAIKIFSRQELKQNREGSDGWAADVLTWEDEEYEVKQVVKWSMGVLNHYEATALRKPRK
jgi:hypothetical protein